MLRKTELDDGRMTHSFTVLTTLPLEVDSWLIALTRWDLSYVTMNRINESYKYKLHIYLRVLKLRLRCSWLFHHSGQKGSLLSNPKPTYWRSGSLHPVKDILPLEYEANVLSRNIGDDYSLTKVCISEERNPDTLISSGDSRRCVSVSYHNKSIKTNLCSPPFNADLC